MPAVSVIIPIYCVEKFIEKCVCSLLEQTLDDLEYIFVNDCTPDNSITVLKRVLDSYPERAAHVTILDMERNSGQAAVRKRGIGAATGDYVICCDSDDWVDPDMYRLMYDKAVVESLDVVICDYYLTDGKTDRYWGQHFHGDPISGLLNNMLSSSTCNKLVRREILIRDDFVYPSENICEDFVYNIQYFVCGRRVGYVDRALYYYFRHGGNSTDISDESSILKKSKQVVSNVSLGLALLERNGLSDRYADDIVRQKLFVKNNYRILLNKHYSLWFSTFKEINFKVLMCSGIPMKERLLYAISLCGLYPAYKRFL